MMVFSVHYSGYIKFKISLGSNFTEKNSLLFLNMSGHLYFISLYIVDKLVKNLTIDS